MKEFTIEIGHTYAPNRLTHLGDVGDFWSPNTGRWFIDTPEAAQLRRIAKYFGESAVRVALLDDIILEEERKNSTGDRWRYAMFIGTAAESVRVGTGAEYVYRESEFEQTGRNIIAQIKDMELPSGYRLSQDGRKLIIGSGKGRLSIPLQGFNDVEDPTFPSCQVLDLAWLQKRLTIAPEAITVLPAGYEEQQRGVETLANLIGINRHSHQNVIYDPAS